MKINFKNLNENFQQNLSNAQIKFKCYIFPMKVKTIGIYGL